MESTVGHSGMKLTWWMRIVGAFYVLDFVMKSFVLAPIRSVGPQGTLEKAAAGDPVASFLVDTWVGFGLETGAIGAALLYASSRPELARALVWAVIAVEVLRGIAYDTYMIARGHGLLVFVTWIAIHTTIIVSAIFCLRSARTAEEGR